MRQLCLLLLMLTGHSMDAIADVDVDGDVEVLFPFTPLWNRL